MDTKKDSSFTDRIQKIITLVGSAEKLANNSGIKASSISQYLSGKTDPSRTRLLALATAAGVNIEWLAAGIGPMRCGDRERFNLALLTSIIEGADKLEVEIGEKLSSLEKAYIIGYTCNLYSDADPNSYEVINSIHDSIKGIYNLLTSLDKMIKTDNGRVQALRIFTRVFQEGLSEEEAANWAHELILARLSKLRLK